MSSGIYAIVHMASGRQYVGSSVAVEVRWVRHKHQLQRGTHVNRDLQAVWTLDGSAAFAFTVLEVVLDRAALREREQVYLRAGVALFNAARTAVRPVTWPASGQRLGALALADLPLPAGFAARFWSKVERTDGCWTWQGSHTDRGYGKVGWHVRMKNHIMYAHRMAYLLTYGEIAAGMQVCHGCDNKECVRPDHLFVGTSHDNHVDMARKGRSGPRPGACGEEHRWARLCAADVGAIRAASAAGERASVLAARYGVDPTTISRIVKRQLWKHLP